MLAVSGRPARLAALVLGAVLLAAACDTAVPSASTPARPTASIDGSAWAVAICQASDQLSLAIVDPATDRPSGAWNEFEAALAGGDRREIERTGNAVLGHLGQAARSANEALAFEPGFEAAVAWWDMVDTLMGAVRDLRDGTIAGDAGKAAAARTTIREVVGGAYPAAAAAMRAVELGGQQLPCG